MRRLENIAAEVKNRVRLALLSSFYRREALET